jgi:hypothetical protein
LLLILFICGIFNDAVSGYGYMDWNYRTIVPWCRNQPTNQKAN